MTYGWSLKRKKAYEAKVANALDKRVKIQHNEADIDTWLPIEHKMTFQVAKHTNFDSFLSKLQKLLNKMEKEVNSLPALMLRHASNNEIRHSTKSVLFHY